MNFSEQKTDLNSSTLTPEQLTLVEMRLTDRKKSMGVAVLLWSLFGVMGSHDFYLNRSIYAILKIFLISFVFFGLFSLIFDSFDSSMGLSNLAFGLPFDSTELLSSFIKLLFYLVSPVVLLYLVSPVALLYLAFMIKIKSPVPVALFDLVFNLAEHTLGVLFIILLLWWICDGFLLKARIQEDTEQKRQKIIQELVSNP